MLTQSQPTAVTQDQHHPVLGIGAGVEDPADLGTGEQLRYSLRLLWDRDLDIEAWPLEHLQIQKTDTVQNTRQLAPDKDRSVARYSK